MSVREHGHLTLTLTLTLIGGSMSIREHGQGELDCGEWEFSNH